ncbi:MAG TPA: response regulator [Nitrospirota bacterium]|nr:response regulator [Nitrospirota bacterium]
MPSRKKTYALLVDSHIRDLFTTGTILQRLDYDVYIASSGEDALKIIDAALPQLIITELSLPHMSGLELLVHLRHNPGTNSIPVIIHTVVDDQIKKEHCRASGCAAYLRKPSEPDVLYQAIQHATERTPRQFMRLRTLLPVRVGGHRSVEAARSIEFVSELSENGVFVRSLNPRPVNTVVPVNLIIHSIPVKLKAVVMRSITLAQGLLKEPGMGLKFSEITETDKELLRNFIKGQIMRDITSQR